VLISYHHDDQDEVEDFCRIFDDEHDICITRALGLGMDQDFIDSVDTDYVIVESEKYI
jgi:hypothetical protein